MSRPVMEIALVKAAGPGDHDRAWLTAGGAARHGPVQAQAVVATAARLLRRGDWEPRSRPMTNSSATGCDAARQGIWNPLTRGRPDATSRITRVPSGRVRVTRAVRSMPTAGQGVLPAEGFSHEPATTVPLLS